VNVLLDQAEKSVLTPVLDNYSKGPSFRGPLNATKNPSPFNSMTSVILPLPKLGFINFNNNTITTNQFLVLKDKTRSGLAQPVSIMKHMQNVS